MPKQGTLGTLASGSSALVTVVVAVVAVVAALVGGLAWYAGKNPASEQRGMVKPAARQAGGNVRWEWLDDRWQAYGQPPACPSPLVLGTPVDLARVTSLLYPGQVRGGDYKAHGGFRFDTSSNAITVRVPLEATVVNASRYLEGGEVQYLFTFQHPCGIRYRFDHLSVLSPTLARIAERLPAAREGDSRGTEVRPPVPVTQGEILATAVGFRKGPNVFIDFGVYDLRQKNAASRNPAWARAHRAEQGHYAVCWLDWLPAGDAARVKRLPASGSARQSDYCR